MSDSPVYRVTYEDLTAEMLDEIMTWTEKTWGGVELVKIEACSPLGQGSPGSVPLPGPLPANYLERPLESP